MNTVNNLFHSLFDKHGKDKAIQILIDCIIKSKYKNYNEYSLSHYNFKFIYFGSSTIKPWHHLSNLAEIKDTIEYNGLIYNSVEHAFQSQLFIESDRIRFSKDGDLGSWHGLKYFFKPEELDKKFKYWNKKYNIGIVAKMASNKKYHKKLKLTSIKTDKQTTFNLWFGILIKKYTIQFYRDILLDTNNHYLCEFDRLGATYPDRVFWGGMIVENKLYGNNKMGKYLMAIRNFIQT
tara:strand:- start:16 stop:720 length:705 start_codon:yes stop_codon:yes gene_type:complete